ncbi:MAG TPA: amidohydrolase family protein [Terracidiphilus sp.]|nr:amidohydrolase family protein [Terracidiphilus sp.]
MPARSVRRSFIACVIFAMAASLPAEVKVVKDFTLIDGTGRPAEAHAAMILNNGRIEWVGPVSRLKPPASAQIVDLKGRYVIPGLIDDHVHLGAVIGLDQSASNETRQNVEHDLRTYALYGVTTVQSLGTDKDFVLMMRDGQRATGRPREARIFSAGQGMVFKNGYGGLAGVNQQIATDAEARAAVDAQAAKHVDLIKLWMDDDLGAFRQKMPYDMAKAIIDEAHKDHLRAVAHVFYLEDAQHLANMGIDGFAHSIRDQPVNQTLLQSMKAHGVWQMAATLSREESIFVYGEGAPFLKVPFFTRGVSPQVVATLSSAAYRQKVHSDPHFRQYPVFLANAERNLKAEAEEGIPYGCGTDSGPPGRFPGYFLHLEMELMVQSGLTPMQALTACTRNAAEFLHANDLGTIEAGKWGDFVVLEKNPLDDIRNTRTIEVVYIAGNPIN